MYFGIGILGWIFWLTLLVIIMSSGLIVLASLRRSWWIAGTNAVLVLVQIVMAIAIWTLLGDCVLPQPSVVEFQQGMSLCPGQAAVFRVPVPLPADKHI